MNTLILYLRRFSWRLRIRDGIIVVQRTLWFNAFIALSIQVIGRFIPLPNLRLWTLVPVLGGLLGITIFSLIKPLPSLQVAQRIDLELGLKERLSTAYYLHNSDTDFHPMLVHIQQQDALTIARNIQDIRLFPLKWSWFSLSTAALLIIITMVFTLSPNPMETILAQREAISQVANEQADQIENLILEERQELQRQFAELAEALRANPGDLEQALADLSEVEQALEQQLDLSQNASQANLDSLASHLESLSSLQNDPNRSQFENLSAALEEITSQLGSMDQDQRQMLADALAQMAAQSAQAGNASLSQTLSDLSQAARSGDQEAASQASQAARQALEKSQTQFADQAALKQAIAQLQSSRQALTQAGQAIAQARSGQSTPGQTPGQGSGQSQGQNSGQGNPAGGGGSSANTLPPATRQGQADRPQGSAPNVQTSELQGQVYAPWQHSPGNTEDLFIPGQDTGQGESQTREGQNPLPGSTNSPLVPYNEVYSNYLNAAYQAMQQSYIPASLLDYVRAYFTQLEP